MTTCARFSEQPVPETPFEILADELGAVAGQIEKESALRIAAAISDMRRIDAERELRLANLERAVADRLATVKDGSDGKDGLDGKDGVDGHDGKDGADGLDGQDGVDGKDGADGRDGRDVEDIEVLQDGATVEFAFRVGEVKSIFEVALPEGPAGRDGADGRDGKDGVDGERGEKGDPGAPGKLSLVAAWSNRVHYEGEVRTHGGGAWQALRDTAMAPPHDDWICVAERGRDGADGAGLNPRKLWVADQEYARLDVVAWNGGCFLALRDGLQEMPGTGDGWMRMASPGRRGERGEKGERGERGLPGPPVVEMTVDDEGLLTLRNADGSLVRCDLYPLLSRLSHG